MRGVRALSRTGQSDSCKVRGALEYLAARHAGMFGVEEIFLMTQEVYDPCRGGEETCRSLSRV